VTLGWREDPTASGMRSEGRNAAVATFCHPRTAAG
jgi:hypothetical protein